ncbi:MAG: non-hydrolyzing UDP-N-acetylglucosamine 2-epimerase [Candidatus Glassbacteria bacterium]
MSEIAVVVGTRPEIIKMSPVIRSCDRHGVDYFILHTGQHYSFDLDEVFFRELGLPEPRYDLKVGSGSDIAQVARILYRIEKILIEEKPEVVLVEGDTNTVLAAGLASSRLGIRAGHVEAGLRSGDRSMPEEINRTLTDHLSDYLFAPTQLARENLLREGIPGEKIFVTGNTIVDAVNEYSPLALTRDKLLEELDLESEGFLLLTLHRQENVDDAVRLREIFHGLSLVYEELGLPILFPVHPRTRKNMRRFRPGTITGLRLIQPVGFIDFLLLEEKSRLILTDSGGIQEEACILGTPCVTLRESTERPESLEVGANVLAGWKAPSVLAAVKEGLERKGIWNNPFGDGRAGERIIQILKEANQSR